MSDATAEPYKRQPLTAETALIGELSTQLQEVIQARTNLGVSLRLAEARVRELEAENAAFKEVVSETPDTPS